ncbi:ATP-grasp domain-containing protein [Paenibacillus xylaniclasticus]|uniref:ATP-grasp domain-containing protein n=1 Tax=Paenibacillus xylaniclasticus TaxID=588083 RepID=UPI000FD97E6F|nr:MULTISPECIES: ATP-grasp domain-containing protein [Paenibacillus]GFN33550.1 hypothetical protein PCURB6_38100 [Paenibacillus curdlanolyticus]
MTTIIVNPMDDAHCRHMVDRLKKLGADFIELGSPITNDYALQNGVLYYNGKPLQSVSSVFFRGVMTHNPDYFQTEESKRYNAQVQFGGRAEVIRGWLRIMHEQGAFVINPPSNTSKYYQLYKLKAAGIQLPETCVTSSVNAAREFVARVGGQAVCKPLPGGSFCRRVDESFWINLHDADTFGEPVIFQNEIIGEDVRVNMLEGQVLSAHVIVTSNEDILDYRTDPNYSNGAITYREVTLPDDVVQMCDRAMKELGLRFSGIDLRLTPEGQYVLIECNSMPAYLDIEIKTAAPITDRIIEFLRMHNSIDSIDNVAPGEYHHNKPFMSQPVATSLFPYFEVMKKWSEQMLQSQSQRVVVPMNDEQKEQLWEKMGKRFSWMEVERRGQEVRIARVW